MELRLLASHVHVEMSYIMGALIVALSGMILNFLVKLYVVRRKFRTLQQQGMPMPPHHPIFGHMLVADRAMSKLPADAQGHYIADEIRRDIPDLGPTYYLDVWPFNYPMLVAASPHTMDQGTQERSLPKHPALRTFLEPLAGDQNLVAMNGQPWKTWRAVFNPGFSAAHLMTLVPDTVKEVETFCEILRENSARGDLFPMKKVTDNLTMDVIGRVVLDSHLNTQRSDNVMASALRRQLAWLSFGPEANPFRRWNPIRPLARWYNARQMDRYISRELDNRFTIYKDTDKVETAKRSKSIIDLAMSTYVAGQAQDRTNSDMDATFKSFAMNQMKIFIFAGHDTTSSTICCTYRLLSDHPSVLRRVRAEHDEVFGEDLALTSSHIIDKPHLLNQLPYTVAVIKETLRCFPPASSARIGEPGYSITDENGRQFPTEGFMVWTAHHGLHHDPKYWPEPESFLPQRWLVPQGDPLYPLKGAWRPFEFGPRSCVGQELAMIEMKTVLVMTLREFDINTAYEQWDEMHPKKGITNVHGLRAYQAGFSAPSEGLPCTVTKASP